MKKTIPVFKLLKCTEQNEGRGPMVTAARFTSKEEAIKANDDPRFFRRHGVQGCKCDAKYNVEAESLDIFETAEEYFAVESESIKKNALNKLSHEEKIALGLPTN